MEKYVGVDESTLDPVESRHLAMLKLQKKIENMKGSKIKQSNNKNNKWRKLNEHPVFFILDLKENILEEITFIICSKSKRSEIEEDQWKAGCRT